MDIDRLKAFRLVAEFGGLQKAAENLKVTVSWVSKQISALERELKCDLFFRNSKKLILSEEGRIFLKSTNSIIYELERARHCLVTNKNTLAGDIVISTTNAMVTLYIIDALADFSKKYQNIHLQIIGSDDTSHLVFGKFDVAIRPFAENHTELQKKKLIDYEMHLYASEDYIEQTGEVETLEDLAKHRIISYGEYAATPYKEINWHLDLLPPNFRPCLGINSGAALLHAVENGLGIAPLSQLGARQSKVPLIKILPQHRGPTVGVYFYYPESMEHSKKINLLYEHLKAFFSH